MDQVGFAREKGGGGEGEEDGAGEVGEVRLERDDEDVVGRDSVVGLR